MAKDKSVKANATAEGLKGKSKDELNTMLIDMRKVQMNLRFQRAGGGLEKTSEIRKLRRGIARVKTFMTQIEISDQKTSKDKAAAPKAAKKEAKSA